MFGVGPAANMCFWLLGPDTETNERAYTDSRGCGWGSG